MGRPKKSLQDKVKEELPEFKDEVDALDSSALTNRLAELAKATEANEQAKEEDEELEEAKQKASEMAAPYSDAKKMIRLKSRYIINLLKEKGSS